METAGDAPLLCLLNCLHRGDGTGSSPPSSKTARTRKLWRRADGGDGQQQLNVPIDRYLDASSGCGESCGRFGAPARQCWDGRRGSKVCSPSSSTSFSSSSPSTKTHSVGTGDRDKKDKRTKATTIATRTRCASSSLGGTVGSDPGITPRGEKEPDGASLQPLGEVQRLSLLSSKSTNGADGPPLASASALGWTPHDNVMEGSKSRQYQRQRQRPPPPPHHRPKPKASSSRKRRSETERYRVAHISRTKRRKATRISPFDSERRFSYHPTKSDVSKFRASSTFGSTSSNSTNGKGHRRGS